MSNDADILARRIAEHLRESEGTAAVWGIKVEEARVGFTRLSMVLRQDMTNGYGTAHGGMIFALADTAFAYACNSRNNATVAAGASIIYLAPAQVGDTLIAEAREEAHAGRSGAYTVSVTTFEGKVVANFQGQSRTVGGAILEN